MGQCQAAIAEAVQVFGKLDILFCCSSEGKAGLSIDGFPDLVKLRTSLPTI